MTKEINFSPGLRRTFALAKKELFSYLYTPAFYGAAVFFLLFSSISLFYFQRYFTLNSATLRPYFSSFPLIFILVIPVLTMKSWAEERKTGSIEILLTMPFSEWNLVLGKFLSAYAMLVMMLILTLPVPLSLLPLGDFDGGVILGEYIGALLMGASSVALGLLFSSLSKSQAGGFISSAVALLVFMMIHQLTMFLSLPHWLSEVINFFSLSFHFNTFIKGLVDSRHLVYYLLSTAIFLFLNTRVILFRKWN